MQQTNTNYGLFFCKTISEEGCITCRLIFLSYLQLHPHNSEHFKFCFLQRQRFMQLVLQLHLMSSLKAWDASTNVVQIGSISFSVIVHPHSSMLISSDQFLFALHHMLLQNMIKNYTKKIFIKFQQKAVIISSFFAIQCKPILNKSVTLIIFSTEFWDINLITSKNLVCNLVRNAPALRKTCPYSELFWFAFFPHLDWIRRDTEYLSVFSLNAGKCEPE